MDCSTAKCYGSDRIVTPVNWVTNPVNYPTGNWIYIPLLVKKTILCDPGNGLVCSCFLYTSWFIVKIKNVKCVQ